MKLPLQITFRQIEPSAALEARIRELADGPKEVPALAGQQEFYLVEQLVQFATLERTGSAMHRSVQPPDVNWPQAFRDLAAYLSPQTGLSCRPNLVMPVAPVAAESRLEEG